MLRILLADRSASARNAMKLHLSRYVNEWQVVAEAEDESSLLAQMASQCPDVVVLHVGLAGWSLSELITNLHALCHGASVLACSGDSEMKAAVLAAGADSFMYLGDPPTRLVTKLRILYAEQASG